VVAGQCWLAVEGVENAVFLDTGDCFVLPSGRPFRLASDLALDSVVTGHWRNWDAESGCHGDKLTNSDDSITTITVSVGYESESAFGKTFKRVMGCSPWQFSRGPMPTQLKLRPGTRNGPLSG